MPRMHRRLHGWSKYVGVVSKCLRCRYIFSLNANFIGLCMIFVSKRSGLCAFLDSRLPAFGFPLPSFISFSAVLCSIPFSQAVMGKLGLKCRPSAVFHQCWLCHSVLFSFLVVFAVPHQLKGIWLNLFSFFLPLPLCVSLFCSRRNRMDQIRESI